MNFFSLFFTIICAREIFFVTLHAILSKNMKIYIHTDMKKSLFVLLAIVVVAMTGCKETPAINTPGDNTKNLDSIPVMIADTNGIEISVDSAIAICNSLPDGGTTAEVYKLSGVVVGNTTHPYEVPYKRRDINFSLSDNGASTSLACYYTKNFNNVSFRKSTEVPLTGSKVVVIGVLTKYVSASGKVTPELKNGYFVRIDSMVVSDFKGCPEPESGEVSVNEAIQIALGLADGSTSPESYAIRGVVATVDLPSAGDLSSYGNFTFSITSDGKSYATCYRLKGKNNDKFTSYDQLQIGDTVLVNAKIQNYHGICEPTSGYVEESSNPNF